MIKNQEEEKSNTPEAVRCKNCETSFESKFCPECGQSIFEYQRPFRFLLADFTGNLFAFDTRFWKSLKALTIQPGKLTRDFTLGKRARYMPPFRFFIFISFIFFLVFSSYLAKAVVVSDENKEKVYKALQEKDSISTFQKETPLLDSIPSSSTDKTFRIDLSSEAAPTKLQSPEDTQEIEKLKTAVTKVMEDPKIYMNSFLKFLSWSLFLLMPVYAFILWLFFRKSSPYYYSHLIMAVNQHSFWFLIGTFVFFLQYIWADRHIEAEFYLLLLLPIHTYFGYKQLYKRSWIRTIFKSLGIFITYGLCLIFAMGAIFAIWVKSEFL